MCERREKPTMTLSSSQAVGQVIVHHSYPFGTTFGVEVDEPDLYHHKNCNILFELNTCELRNGAVQQSIQNISPYNRSSSPILLDTAMVESILLKLKEGGEYPISTTDPYILGNDSTIPNESERTQKRKAYDSLTPMRKIILDELLNENEILIDCDKSVPLSGPIAKFTKLVRPLTITARGDENCFVDSIIGSKMMTGLFGGNTQNEFSIQIPANRCFFSPPHSNRYQKIFLVIAPYNESVIPVNICQKTSYHNNYMVTGLSSVKFHDSIPCGGIKTVQHPSYSISYMMVPENWTPKAVMSEVVNRCKHYSHQHFIHSFWEFAIISLGTFSTLKSADAIERQIVETTTMYILKNVDFHVGDWHTHTFQITNNIDITHQNRMITEQFSGTMGNKTIPLTSLSSRITNFNTLENMTLVTYKDALKKISTDEEDQSNLDWQQKFTCVYKQLLEKLDFTHINNQTSETLSADTDGDDDLSEEEEEEESLIQFNSTSNSPQHTSTNSGLINPEQINLGLYEYELERFVEKTQPILDWKPPPNYNSTIPQPPPFCNRSNLKRDTIEDKIDACVQYRETNSNESEKLENNIKILNEDYKKTTALKEQVENYVAKKQLQSQYVDLSVKFNELIDRINAKLKDIQTVKEEHQAAVNIREDHDKKVENNIQLYQEKLDSVDYQD